jgi:hypothetical protein
MNHLPEPTSPASLRAWRLTNDHLVLSLPMLETGGRAWPTYDDEWGEAEVHFLAIARQVRPEEALERLTELFQRAWTSGFRGVGVQKFFENAARERHGYVAGVHARIDKSLAERRPPLSDAAARLVIDSLVDDLHARGPAIAEDARRRTAASVALQQRLAEIRNTWGQRLRPAERGKRLAEAAFLLREDYAARTFAVGGAFAQLLIAEIITELGESRS